MYINSTYFASGKDSMDEYRAMLTAKKDAGGGYTGDLSLYGTGKAAAFSDGAVSFTLTPFDRDAYAAAGGQLSGTFDAYGVIPAKGADYFVLMDGGAPVLEPKNSGMAFYGKLLPEEQYAQSKHEADETKQLMHTLYDGTGKSYDVNDFLEKFKDKDMTDPEVQEEIQQYTSQMITMAKPKWYPDWLMPKPVRLLSGGE